MSKNRLVGFGSAVRNCNLSPLSDREVERRRKVRGQTGRGPSGPSEKALGRLAATEAAQEELKRQERNRRRRELAAAKRIANEEKKP